MTGFNAVKATLTALNAPNLPLAPALLPAPSSATLLTAAAAVSVLCGQAHPQVVDPNTGPATADQQTDNSRHWRWMP
ncbi:hypothetical protein LWC34_16655 [Kibdelosporangium philippinense]|uniref:Uncharacterized protein n=1 Tax=Kibdelosporangium philippinense TaxID=211113 RepID=A0ABS8ZF35_9PSEU|nr:hypothetical protein [Kibdelosporangium philippinense]MCE7004452.1 hypothetical protein [Kibdelosporangium philippinense]